mmetsp:Transcript_38631/g.77339  ORF Transcript_38631/g.77339 Transcript_38631/m.77339 type:complete len:338 (-) Transcript_38631:211-1224(-)
MARKGEVYAHAPLANVHVTLGRSSSQSTSPISSSAFQLTFSYLSASTLMPCPSDWSMVSADSPMFMAAAASSMELASMPMPSSSVSVPVIASRHRASRSSLSIRRSCVMVCSAPSSTSALERPPSWSTLLVLSEAATTSAFSSASFPISSRSSASGSSSVTFTFWNSRLRRSTRWRSVWLWRARLPVWNSSGVAAGIVGSTPSSWIASLLAGSAAGFGCLRAADRLCGCWRGGTGASGASCDTPKLLVSRLAKGRGSGAFVREGRRVERTALGLPGLVAGVEASDVASPMVVSPSSLLRLFLFRRGGGFIWVTHSKPAGTQDAVGSRGFKKPLLSVA